MLVSYVCCPPAGVLVNDDSATQPGLRHRQSAVRVRIRSGDLTSAHKCSAIATFWRTRTRERYADTDLTELSPVVPDADAIYFSDETMVLVPLQIVQLFSK